MKHKIESGLIPPHDIEFEEVVLGALLLEPEAINQVSSILNPDSFYLDSHKIVFNATKALFDTHRPIDLLTVTKYLRDTGKLEEIGGAIFVTQLTARVASAGHIEYHARVIAELSMRRQMISQAREFISTLYDDNLEIDNSVELLKKSLDGIINGTGGSIGKRAPQILNEAMTEIQEAIAINRKGGLAGISTGFKMLDLCTGGWRKGILAVIAARTGIGKTSLAMHFLKEAVKLDRWVVLYSFEMSAAKLGQFMLSAISGIDRNVIRDGYMSDQELSSIELAAKTLEKQKIRIIDSGLSTIEQIKTDVLKSVNRSECDLVIVDYIGLVKTGTNNKYVSNADRVAEISGALKQISLSNSIPVICLAQLNREAEKFEEPQLHHLRDSGAIEQDADLVLMPYYDERTGTRQFKLKVAKNRDGGAGGSFEIFPNDQFNVFSDRNPENDSNAVYNPNMMTEPQYKAF